jgi:CelD/BcsL family acetyltransferase involved in cellulose biosynthesis
MNIQCVQDYSGFLRLRDEWNSLWGQSKTASCFTSHDWIRCCWDELRLANKMRVFVVRRGTEPMIIAPWMRSRGYQHKLPVKRLTFIEHPESQIADILCADSPEAKDGFKQLLTYLRRERSNDWQLLALNKVAHDSPVVQWLDHPAHLGQNLRPVQCTYPVFIVPLIGTWEDYLRSKSSRFRKTLRNIVNRIERMGNVAIHCHEGTELAVATLQKLFSIADASWKLASGVAVTSSEGRRRFFEEVLRSSTIAEHMRIWFLEVNGQAVASEIQVVDRGTVYALRSDYDEKYADSSPGVYLQLEILKKLFGGDHQVYNFGVGLNPYKARWAEHTAGLVNYRIYNGTLYSRLLEVIDRNIGREADIAPRGMVAAPYSGKDA